MWHPPVPPPPNPHLPSPCPARSWSPLVLQELSIYGKLRKVSNCGPVSMFRSLLVTWKDKYPPHVISKRVKDFFRWVIAISK